MSESAYANVTKAEDLFRDLAWKPMVELAKTALFANAAWLNAWPLKQIISYLIDVFSKNLFEAMRLCLDLKVIAFINAEHKKEYDNAASRLSVIAHDKGITSKEFLEEKERAKNALSKFVRYGATV